MIKFSTILAVDTHQRDSFTLALYQSGKELAVKEFPERAQDIQKEIEIFLDDNHIKIGSLGALAFVTKSDSLTGTRIGAVAVNTLAWILEIPIIPLGEALTHNSFVEIYDTGSKIVTVSQLENIN